MSRSTILARMESRPTYSRCSRFERATSEVLFEQVVLKDNVFDDTNVQEDAKQKKGQSRRKREEKRQIEKQTTNSIFEFDEVPKFTKRKGRQLMTQLSQKNGSGTKKRKVLPKRAAKEKGREISSYETAETSLSLNIESFGLVKQVSQVARSDNIKAPSTRKGEPACFQREKTPKNSKKGSRLRRHAEDKRTMLYLGEDRPQERAVGEKNVLADGDQSSMEVARDNSDHVLPLSVLRRGSPLFPLVLSGMAGDSADDLFMEKEDFDQMAWVSISSRPKDSSQESQYTFTLTDADSATTTSSGTKTTSKSPTVHMHKKQPHLNSSVRKGKRDLKDIEFPSFISPIGLMKAQSVTAKQTVAKSSVLSASENNGRKCSTMFLESGSCQAQLESPGLTAIRSGITQPVDQGRQKSTDSDTAALTEKQRQECKVRASTPKDKAVPVSLSLSPVLVASWDEEELPVRESVEVNTSEILVPSLMQITELPRRDESAAQVAELQAVAEDNVAATHTTKITASSRRAPSIPTLTATLDELERERRARAEGDLRVQELEQMLDDHRDSMSAKMMSLEKRVQALQGNLFSAQDELQAFQDRYDDAVLALKDSKDEIKRLREQVPKLKAASEHQVRSRSRSRSPLSSHSPEEYEDSILVKGRQGAQDNERDYGEESVSNVERIGCIVDETSDMGQSIADAVEMSRRDKSAHSKPSRLPLCFVNRLCKLHQQKQSRISRTFPFTVCDKTSS